MGGQYVLHNSASAFSASGTFVRADCATTLQCVVAKLAPPSWRVPGVAFNTPRLLNHGSMAIRLPLCSRIAPSLIVGQPHRLPGRRSACPTNFIQNAIYCAHSSNAAGLPRKCARTSPAKWSEPVIRIGFGLARTRSSASPIDVVMEIVGQPRRLPAGDAPALQTER